MCKKLSIFCLMLAVVATLNMPVYAGSPIKLGYNLNVDIDGDGSTTQPNWRSWALARNLTGPISKTFDMGGLPWENPVAEIDFYRKGKTPVNEGGSRNRSSGLAFTAGTGEFGPTTKGFGMNYIKLTLSQLDPDTQYKVCLWSYEQHNVWSVNAANPLSKFGFWSTTNPKTWLDTNAGLYPGIGDGTHDPNGYGPKQGAFPIYESNMPAALKATGMRFNMQAPAEPNAPLPLGTQNFHYADLTVMSNSDGVITLYGWVDSTDWGGSQHIPLNGFTVVPEPATVALLGLGGLALLRRKRT